MSDVICNRCGHYQRDVRVMSCEDCQTELPSAAGVVPDTESEVCKDIAARQSSGIRKYGQTVANNPLELKAWLQHAYEECLDQAVYLKRAIQEMDATP